MIIIIHVATIVALVILLLCYRSTVCLSMSLATRPKLLSRGGQGIFMLKCTTILVHAVHMKAKQALTSQHKC